jgi:hypothetical protein
MDEGDADPSRVRLEVVAVERRRPDGDVDETDHLVSGLGDNEALLWLRLGAHVTKMAYTMVTARRLTF